MTCKFKHYLNGSWIPFLCQLKLIKHQKGSSSRVKSYAKSRLGQISPGEDP